MSNIMNIYIFWAKLAIKLSDGYKMGFCKFHHKSLQFV